MEISICVGESLNVATVAEQRESWLKALTDNQGSLRLLVDQLTSIDTPGLQLLIAIRIEAAKQGKLLVLSGASDLLQDRCRLLGLDAALRRANSVTG